VTPTDRIQCPTTVVTFTFRNFKNGNYFHRRGRYFP